MDQKLLIAGTEANGIYFYNLIDADPTWVQHYFFNRTIPFIYVQQHGVGPADYSGIFATIIPDSVDKTLIYYNDYPVQSYWAKKDSGLDIEVNKIACLTGFDYSGHEPPLPVFASSNDSVIFILNNNSVWEKSWVGPKYTVINTLYSNNSTVWGGGIIQGAFGILFLVNSKDYGKNWEVLYPPFGEIYSCYSIISQPEDSLILYAGLNGLVIKSTDAGKIWNAALEEENIVFNSLAINPLNPDIVFAGGKTIDNSFVLFKSINGGTDWEQIIPMINCCVKGINNITSTTTGNIFTLYIATDGTGVFKYSETVVSVYDNKRSITDQFKLEQNFPNPFNPTTNIGFRIAESGLVILKVYNVLGGEVATLANEEKPAGEYEIEFNALELSSGVYFYTLTVGSFRQTKNMLVIK